MVDRYAQRLRELGMQPPDTRVDADASEIESMIGTSIPGAFRAFLQQGAGYWGDICCTVEEPCPFGDHVLCEFCGLDEIEEMAHSMIAPRNMITVGSGHFCAFTCLSVCGVDRGAVYALDSEFRSRWPDELFYEPFDSLAESIEYYLQLRRDGGLPAKHDSYDSLYRLAPDWDTFLSRCRPCDT